MLCMTRSVCVASSVVHTVPVCDECEVVSLRNDKRTDDRSQQLHKATLGRRHSVFFCEKHELYSSASAH